MLDQSLMDGANPLLAETPAVIFGYTSFNDFPSQLIDHGGFVHHHDGFTGTGHGQLKYYQQHKSDLYAKVIRSGSAFTGFTAAFTTVPGDAGEFIRDRIENAREIKSGRV